MYKIDEHGNPYNIYELDDSNEAQQEEPEDEYFDDREEEDESELSGYECLCCGSDFDESEVAGSGDSCPNCGAYALSEIYF